MSSKKNLNRIVKDFAIGFRCVDKERRQPTVVMTFVALRDLAKEVGQEALEQLIDLMEPKPQEGTKFPLITLQIDDRSLNVAVINLEDVIGLEGKLLPFFQDMARFSAGLAQYIVLAKKDALFVFSQEVLGKAGKEVLQSAIRLGAYLRPHSVESIDEQRCIFSWFD
jgi:hypothetical protein